MNGFTNVLNKMVAILSRSHCAKFESKQQWLGSRRLEVIASS